MYYHKDCGDEHKQIGLTATAIVNLTMTTYDPAKFWLEEPEGMAEDLVSVVGIFCYGCNETIKTVQGTDLETFEAQMAEGEHADVLGWDADE